MNLTTNNKGFKSLAHFCIWLLLFSLPYLLSSGEPSSTRRILEHSWLPLLFYMIVFYTNYFYLTDAFLFKKKITAYLLVNIGMIAIFIWFNIELRKLCFATPQVLPKIPKFTRPPAKYFIYKDIIAMIVPVIVAIATKTTENWARTEAEKKEAEKENLKSELQHLKYQLQPHFFFNSLNNIYSLVDSSPDKAKETIHALAKLMRYLLYETDADKVQLSSEIDFMKKYIDLMRLRTSDKTVVTASFPVIEKDYSVAPLLFISLIENAFKHGVSATQKSDIRFNLSLEANTLSFTAENNNFHKTDTDKSGSGIGLNNLKKRLELLYPGRYVFNIENHKDTFKVTLKIDIG